MGEVPIASINISSVDFSPPVSFGFWNQPLSKIQDVHSKTSSDDEISNAHMTQIFGILKTQYTFLRPYRDAPQHQTIHRLILKQ